MFSDSNKFKELMMRKFFTKKADAWDYCLKNVRIDGVYLEFGVKAGKSLLYLAKKIKPKIIYGFDSWEGLPTPWNKSPSLLVPKGKYKRSPLKKAPNNIRLVNGLFSSSIPKFCKENKFSASFVHCDCDLYQSAKDVLWGINDMIVPGTIIQFDEICDWKEESYVYWKDHEFKAADEWCREFNRVVQSLCSNSKTGGAVVVVK